MLLFRPRVLLYALMHNNSLPCSLASCETFSPDGPECTFVTSDQDRSSSLNDGLAASEAGPFSVWGWKWNVVSRQRRRRRRRMKKQLLTSIHWKLDGHFLLDLASIIHGWEERPVKSRVAKENNSAQKHVSKLLVVLNCKHTPQHVALCSLFAQLILNWLFGCVSSSSSSFFCWQF